MEMDLNTPINLDTSISNTSFFAGVNANRAISRGKKVGFKERALPRYGYYNVRGEFLSATEATLAPQATVSSSETVQSEQLQTPTPTPLPTFPILLSAEPAPSATSQSTPTSTSNATPQTAQASQSMPRTVVGGGGTGGGGGGATSSEEKSTEKLGAGDAKAECYSNYWILGLALGAIGGYIYAKTKKKEVLKSVLIISAIGGGAGFIVDKIICKDKESPVTVIPPKTEEKK